MDALTAITSRISPGKLGEPGPTPAQLDKLIAAAVAAPDHGRLRPWRFLVIEGAARDRFGEMMAASLRRREPEAPGAKLEAEKAKAQRAPLILVIATVPQPSPKIPEIEQVMAVAAAAQNVSVAAHAMGLGVLWRTGPASYDPAVKEALGFAAADTIVGFMYVGTPVIAGRPRDGEPAPIIRRL